MASNAPVLRDCYTDETFEGGKREAKCRFCKKIIKGKGTTTSNYLRHIESVHPKE